MQIESKKTFKSGFVLREPDLRRIVDLIQDQFAKLSDGKTPFRKFSLKLKNGAIVHSDSLDEILSLENGGSTRIVRLGYQHALSEDDQSTLISIEFSNTDLDDERRASPMRFQVHANNRDWVFVTSSLLEERCEKIKRFAPDQLAGKGPAALALRLFAPTLFLLITMAMMFTTLSSIDKRPAIGALLEEQIKSGAIKEPLDAMVFVQKQNDAIKMHVEFLPLRFIATSLFLLICVVVFFAFFGRYYPVFNFCWGDYLEEFQKIESRRQFWVVVVIVGLALSFLGGILANNVGLLHNWLAP